MTNDDDDDNNSNKIASNSLFSLSLHMSFHLLIKRGNKKRREREREREKRASQVKSTSVESKRGVVSLSLYDLIELAFLKPLFFFFLSPSSSYSFPKIIYDLSVGSTRHEQKNDKWREREKQTKTRLRNVSSCFSFLALFCLRI